jgi:hypothetical protein
MDAIWECRCIVDYMVRKNAAEIDALPKIPAHAIGYDEAQVLLR